MKKVLINGLAIALIIVVIAFVPNAGNRLLSWLVPPRLFILLAAIIIIILLKILFELRNKNNQQRQQDYDPEPEPVPVPEDVQSYQQYYQYNGQWYINPNYDPSVPNSEGPQVIGLDPDDDEEEHDEEDDNN